MDENAIVPQPTPRPTLTSEEWPWPHFPQGAPRNVQRYGSVPLTGWEGDFLAAYRDNGIIRAACRIARISPMTVARRRESDPAFARAYLEANAMAVDILESEAWRRAVRGVVKTRTVTMEDKDGKRLVRTESVTEYSDGLLKFLLQGNRPEKYREQIDHNHNVHSALEEARRQAIEQGLNPDEVVADAKRLMGLE